MAYVVVPKDLTKVKNKVAFNLTKRQIICFGAAALIGVPTYFLTRNTLGNTNAMAVMVLIMLPAFLAAMYEKDGMPFEVILKNIITTKFRRPAIRRYESMNFYEASIGSQAISGKQKGAKKIDISAKQRKKQSEKPKKARRC